MGVGIWCCCWGCLDGHAWPGLGASLEVRCLFCLARFGGLLCVRRADFSFSIFFSLFLSLYLEEDIVIVVSRAVLLRC